MAKKDLKYYLSLNYPMVVRWDSDDNMYVVEFADLPGCVAHGKTPLNAFRSAQKVKEEWLDVALSSDVTVPEPKAEEDYSGKFVVRIPPALHMRLSEQAASEGRSLNAHIATLLSERSAAITVEKATAVMITEIKKATQTFITGARQATVAITKSVSFGDFDKVPPASKIAFIQ